MKLSQNLQAIANFANASSNKERYILNSFDLNTEQLHFGCGCQNNLSQSTMVIDDYSTMGFK